MKVNACIRNLMWRYHWWNNLKVAMHMLDVHWSLSNVNAQLSLNDAGAIQQPTWSSCMECVHVSLQQMWHCEDLYVCAPCAILLHGSWLNVCLDIVMWCNEASKRSISRMCFKIAFHTAKCSTCVTVIIRANARNRQLPSGSVSDDTGKCECAIYTATGKSVGTAVLQSQ